MHRVLGRVGALILFVWHEHNHASTALANGDLQSQKMGSFYRLFVAELLIDAGVAVLLYPLLHDHALTVFGVLAIFASAWRLYAMFCREWERSKVFREQMKRQTTARQVDWLTKTAEQMAEEMYRARIERQVNRIGLPVYVYFVLDTSRHAVKIGISTDVQKRLGQLQTSTTAPLTLLATEKGDKRLEKRLHKRFAGYHISGEWFHYTEEIKQYIAEIE